MRTLLAAGLLVAALGVPSAAAAGGLTTPGDGTVVTADTVVLLRGVAEGPTVEPTEMVLQAPTGSAQVVAVQASPDGGELAHDLATAGQPNGTWTVSLRGGTTDARAFSLRVPPAAPDGVAAVPLGDGVQVSWRQGEEPDLRAWAVEDGAGRVLQDGIGLEACDTGRTCRVDLPADAGSWSVRAYRATCPDCEELLASEASTVLTVEGVAPATAAPTAPAAAAAAPQVQARTAPQGARGFTPPGSPATVAVPRLERRAVAPPSGPVDASLEYAAPGDDGAGPVAGVVGEVDRWRLLLLSALAVGASIWLRRWARRVIEPS